jgi:hypothetical protein
MANLVIGVILLQKRPSGADADLNPFRRSSLPGVTQIVGLCMLHRSKA